MILPLTPDEFSLKKTFECGQCFRFDPLDEYSYIGIAGDSPLILTQYGDHIKLSCGNEEYKRFWRCYFDMDFDYEAVRVSLARDDFMRNAADFGQGIRILRQSQWEALCSFIISQCNNIPRIKGIISRLCELYGEPREVEGHRLFSFPTPDRIAGLSTEKLVFLRCGYRASYIISAAEAVCGGLLDKAEQLDTDSLRDRLTNLRGVGNKVADCVLLFGFHRFESFPADIWIKRAVAEHGIDPAVFGVHAGLAQQYIYYYTRENAMKRKI